MGWRCKKKNFNTNPSNMPHDPTKPHSSSEKSKKMHLLAAGGAGAEGLANDGLTYVSTNIEFLHKGKTWTNQSAEAIQCIQDCGKDQNGRFESCALDCLF